MVGTPLNNKDKNRKLKFPLEVYKFKIKLFVRDVHERMVWTFTVTDFSFLGSLTYEHKTVMSARSRLVLALTRNRMWYASVNIACPVPPM